MNDLSKVGITGFGGYVPRLRLSRKAIAQANSWFNPGIAGQAKGERSMANWDEDSITMSVEAARDCMVGQDPNAIDGIFAASTSFPFQDRQNAGIIATALSLDEMIHSADITSCQKAGLTALLNGVQAVGSGAQSNALVVAGEKRKTRAGAPQDMKFGDGAAAVSVGSENVIAKFLGSASLTIDFVDHFRGEGEDFDYNWEERWIRDEGLTKIMPRAVKAALEKAGVEGADIDHFVMPCGFKGIPQKIARAANIDPENVRDTLGDVCGDTGAAHPLVMLVHALEHAKPGEKIVIAAFGQGAEAIVLETTADLPKLGARRGIIGSLANRREETNYMKWLAFNGLVEMEKGMRAEKDNKTALSVTYRRRDMLFGLVGGKCSKCGTQQFPRTRICVNPNCHATDTQEPHSFANQSAKILSWSADHLTYSMDPPQHFGMVTFEDGGRFMADFTDVEQGTIDSGMDVRMVFRIKDFDTKRGFRKYFWKAVPVQPKQQAAE